MCVRFGLSRPEPAKGLTIELFNHLKYTAKRSNFCERREKSQVVALSKPKGRLNFAESSKNHGSIFEKLWHYIKIYQFLSMCINFS
jgi:hypothetical protein